MRAEPSIRRTDLVMPDPRVRETLGQGYCGRLATVGADGAPYCVPLLYVWEDEHVYLHTTAAHGHLRRNVEHDPRVCFVVDEPGEVFPYGRFECDTTIAYRSVIVSGRIAIIDDSAARRRFFARLMAKYGPSEPGRPAGFLPRIDSITLYAISPERMTGKEIALPPPSQRWPALDRTKTPHARPDPAGDR